MPKRYTVGRVNGSWVLYDRLLDCFVKDQKAPLGSSLENANEYFKNYLTVEMDKNQMFKVDWSKIPEKISIEEISKSLNYECLFDGD
jgi:predicted HTH transcriptional regulator